MSGTLRTLLGARAAAVVGRQAERAMLLKLAEELNAEVAKASMDARSPMEMRKIEDIERLAHNVQQKMKLTVGAS